MEDNVEYVEMVLGCGHQDGIVLSVDLTPEDARELAGLIICNVCLQRQRAMAREWNDYGDLAA